MGYELFLTGSYKTEDPEISGTVIIFQRVNVPKVNCFESEYICMSKSLLYFFKMCLFYFVVIP